jgi:hypothetical protein
MARRANELSLGFDFYRIFIDSIKHLKVFVVSVSLWQALLVLGVAVLLSLVVRQQSVRAMRRKLVGIVVATGLVIYGSFVVFGYVGYGMNYRSFALPSLALTIGSVAVLTLLFTQLRGVLLRPVLVAICLAMSIVGLADFAAHQMEFLVVRAALNDERDQSVRAQLKTDATEILVQELPVLIDHSEVVDLSATGQGGWFESNFRRYYHIDEGRYLPVLPATGEYRALEFDNFNFLNERIEAWQK